MPLAQKTRLNAYPRVKLLTPKSSIDVSGNALTSLTEDELLNMPELQSLQISQNRLQALPDISTWGSLTNLAAANNGLASFPYGMVSLPNLRNIDLAGNNLKKLDDNLALMDNLSMLNIANNPVRILRATIAPFVLFGESFTPG